MVVEFARSDVCCGGVADDTAEAIIHRIATYKEQTVPVVQHYARVAGVVLKVTTTNKKPASYVYEQAEAKLDAAESMGACGAEEEQPKCRRLIIAGIFAPWVFQ